MFAPSFVSHAQRVSKMVETLARHSSRRLKPKVLGASLGSEAMLLGWSVKSKTLRPSLARIFHHQGKKVAKSFI
jgi:hypothetical protein